MRQSILTEREKQILEAYVKQGIRLDGFSVLRLRSQRLEAKLKGELELIQAALTRFEKEKQKSGKKEFSSRSVPGGAR